MKIYIPSYFGPSSRRQAAFQAQSQWLQAQNFDPYYFVQARDPQDISTVVGSSSEPLHPGMARNHLLAHFYASDDDWAVFADDDTVLLTDQTQVLETIRPFLSKMPEYVACVKPGIGSSARMISDKSQMLDVSRRDFGFTNALHGSWFFLRNLRKAHNQTLWFDSAFTLDPFVAMEDADFGVQIIDQGWRILSASSLFVTQDLTQESTWSDARNVKRLQSNQRGKELLSEKWPRHCRTETYSSVQLVSDSRSGRNPRLCFDHKWIKSNEKVVKNWELPLFSFMKAREAVAHVRSEEKSQVILDQITDAKWGDRLNYTIENPPNVTLDWTETRPVTQGNISLDMHR